MWSTKGNDVVVAELVTDPSTGLSSEVAAKRLKVFGPIIIS